MKKELQIVCSHCGENLDLAYVAENNKCNSCGKEIDYYYLAINCPHEDCKTSVYVGFIRKNFCCANCRRHLEIRGNHLVVLSEDEKTAPNLVVPAY